MNIVIIRGGDDMLSAVFDLNELSVQNEESIRFVKYIIGDLNTILISSDSTKNYDIFEKNVIDITSCKLEKYQTIEEFLHHNRDKVEDWFLVVTNRNIPFALFGQQFVGCPYEFWGAIDQFEESSFTEHAKKKLLYNELSWLYMDSIANDTDLEVSFLKKIFEKHSVKKILDCCCGVGRHASRLGDCGFKVTGIDASSHQIETAMKQNVNDNVEYHVCDARNFALPSKYDAAICMWTTYNYFSKESDMVSFLNTVSAHLCSGGILVLDSKNIPILSKNRLYHRETKRDNLKLTLLVYKRVIGMIQNSQYFYFINNGQEKRFCIDEEFVRFYKLNELIELNSSRFKLINTYGDFDGNEFDTEKSTRMITVWEKCKC